MGSLMHRETLGLAMVLLLVATASKGADAQSVGDVLLDMYHKYAGPVFKAAADVLTVGLTQTESGVVLPACKETKVLLSAGGFPTSWGQLTAQQQAHHPINLVMLQLAYSAYRPLEEVKACLAGMGVDPSSISIIQRPVLEFSTNKVAYVLRAGSERVFLLLRGSSESDIHINIACRHVMPGDELFGGQPGSQKIKVHHGFYRTWQALEPDVLAALHSQLKQVRSQEVYVIGHSLGAAAGAIGALRLQALLPGRVSGVWLFAPPRSGCPDFAAAYNAALLHKTLRFSNFMDFAVRAPAATQSCSLQLPIKLGGETAQFSYTHVGRSLLMCPEADSGLTEFRLSPNGTNNPDCFVNSSSSESQEELDASGVTHQLGSYWDAWRRGYYRYHGTNLANDTRLQAVLCSGCLANGFTFRMQQVRAPARAGGAVTCAVDASCSSQAAFMAATALGPAATAKWSNASACSGHMCTPASVPAPPPPPPAAAATPAPPTAEAPQPAPLAAATTPAATAKVPAGAKTQLAAVSAAGAVVTAAPMVANGLPTQSTPGVGQ